MPLRDLEIRALKPEARVYKRTVERTFIWRLIRTDKCAHAGVWRFAKNMPAAARWRHPRRESIFPRKLNKISEKNGAAGED